MPQLGSAQLSTRQLGDTVPFVGMKTTSTDTTSTDGLQPTSKSDMSMGTTTPTVGTAGSFAPVILDPQNINVEYNTTREVWESAWIPTDTFDPQRDQLLVVMAVDEGTDPIDVVIERDLSGDETADVHTDILTVTEDTQIARAEPQGERGSYRLVFPTYNQTDVVDRLNVALTYDNTERLIENIPYQFLRNDIRSDNLDGSDDIEPLIEALGTTLDRIDATVDSLYDNLFAESARGQSLNKIGKPLGIQRRDIGNPERSDDLEGDQRLRKRVVAAKALVGLDTTNPSFSQLLGILFPDAVTAIDINAVSGKPAVEVVIPTNTVDRNPLNTTEIQDILRDAVAAEQTVNVTTSGTYDYETAEAVDDDAYNDGRWKP